MSERVTVFYDRDCGFCRWSLGLLLAWDRHRRLRPAPIQSPEGDAALGHLPQEKRLASAHARLPDGRVLSGGHAFEPIARLLPAGAPLAALAHRAPGAAVRGYRAVADRRTTFGPRLPRSWVAAGDRRIASRS